MFFMPLTSYISLLLWSKFVLPFCRTFKILLVPSGLNTHFSSDFVMSSTDIKVATRMFGSMDTYDEVESWLNYSERLEQFFIIRTALLYQSVLGVKF